jgi:ribosome-binding factor A
MKQSSPQSLTQRQLRVGEEIRHVLAYILSRSHYPGELFQKVSITVTEVRMSTDLKIAKVYVLPLQGYQQDNVVEALNKASSFYRGEMGKKLSIKFIPNLKFYVDKTFDQAARIENLLQSPHVKQDL